MMVFQNTSAGQPGGPQVNTDQGGLVRGFGVSNIAVTDADLTPTALQINANVLQVITGTYTAQRKLIMPVVACDPIVVFNNQAGAFGVQVIGATGTGVVIAQTKRAVVYCDGTNWVRVTADT
jgi:hypothetical protein